MWWARDRVDRAAFESRAECLVGTVLAHVRYFDMDASDGGVRVVSEEHEWLDPPWRNDDHDLLDWGLELETHDGRTFAAIWYVNPFEGIDFDEERLLETRFGPAAPVAIWDVTSTEAWSGYIGRTVTRVQVCWERMERKAYACHAVVLEVSNAISWSAAKETALASRSVADAARARTVGPYSSRQMDLEPRFRERVARWFRPT